MDQSSSGILFAVDSGAISAPGNRSTYTRNDDYLNDVTFSGTTGQSCSISALPSRQYDPGAPGYDPQGSNPDSALSATFSF